MGKDVHNKASEDMLRVLRGNSEQERILHRLHSVALVLNGLSCSEAARLFGDSARSVAYWVKRFEESGVNGLEEAERTGRPSKLKPVQMKQVRTLIEKHTKSGEPITAKALSFFINQKFGVSLTIRQCRRILNGLRN